MDKNLIRLVKNDFQLAKSYNPNVATLLFDGLIMQFPNETFLQTTENGVAFAGAIQVDLIDRCEKVIKNIDDNFYYTSFIDDKGIPQINFEFGNIGTDYYTKLLYLKVTDLVNGAIFYSNSFLVTEYYKQLSSRIDYKNDTDLHYQSIRLSNCYDLTPVNEKSAKQYTTSSGKRVNYKQTNTYLRKYKIDAVDYFLNDRLSEVFNCDIIYLNNERVVINDFKTTEREEYANIMPSEFICNFQGETFTFTYQIYQYLTPVTLTPLNNSIMSSFNGLVSILFNKPISGTTIVNLYENNTLVATETATITTNLLEVDFSAYSFTNANYSIVIDNGQVKSGVEVWSGFRLNDWAFEIASGQFSSSEFDSDFLI